MRNIKCVIAYDGSGFSGWQVQAGARTVQGVVEDAVSTIVGHPVRVTASGRTDAGVHALGQVIHFPTGSAVPLEGLVRGVNSVLPGDVAVQSAVDAPLDFDDLSVAEVAFFEKFVCGHVRQIAQVVEIGRLHEKLNDYVRRIFVVVDDVVSLHDPSREDSAARPVRCVLNILSGG